MDLGSMLFQGWPGLFRTVVVGALAYVTLVLFLRISGKRTLAKLNAFDLVVTGEERQVLLGNATGKDNARRGGYPRGWRAWAWRTQDLWFSREQWDAQRLAAALAVSVAGPGAHAR
jgi:hypothetical protein